jgi:hypothetical protein
MRILVLAILASAVLLVGGAPVHASEAAAPPEEAAAEAPAVPGPPPDVVAIDQPNDTGESILLQWKPAPHDGKGEKPLVRYIVYRAESPEGPWQQIAALPPGNVKLKHSNDVVLQNRDLEPVNAAGEVIESGAEGQVSIPKPANGVSYWFKVEAWDGETAHESEVVGPVVPAVSYFHTGRLIVLFSVIIFVALIVLMIALARAGKELYIRPIAGVQAVEEAIGRATEMGRPVLFVPGLSSIQDVATLAALNVLGRVAEKTAEYDTRILVPNRDAIVFTVAQEIVREAHSAVGRPDSFDEKSVYFVSDQQFAYAAAVQGLMVREKPATNFLLGMFWAESLLLAETGNMTGAIQIAGTDAVTQLPFFIVACDYTLIGEELYAAGAYMGKDPKLTGSLKGQDLCKAVVILCLMVGLVLAAAFTVAERPDLLADFVDLFRVKN